MGNGIARPAFFWPTGVFLLQGSSLACLCPMAAMFYAFIAMVKDDIAYARKAKDMLMWMMRMQIQNNGA